MSTSIQLPRARYTLDALRLTLFFVIGCGSCEEDPLPETPLPPHEPAPPVIAPRPIATLAAFDLIVAPHGALLAFGPPGEAGGGVRVLALSPIGERSGDEVVVFERAPTVAVPLPPYAVEIDAASGGGRVAVSWVVRDGLDAKVGVAQGTADGPAFGPPLDLGETEAPDRVTRGLLAAAGAPDGTLSLLHRAGRGPCGESGRDDCVELVVRRLDGSPGSSERQGVGLSVPEVCASPIAGYVWADGTWYYGVCAASERGPETTVYAIRFEPQYAHADRSLTGCAPLGLARAGEGAVLVVGRCGADRVDAVRASDVGQDQQVLPNATRTAACVDGRPVLSIRGGDETVELPMTEPMSNLAPLLPPSMASDRARAVWTGRAVLVATPSGREVVVTRYECDEGELRRTDVL